MSAYAELSAAVREPMREWWISSGSWWLLGIAAASVAFLLLGLAIQFAGLPLGLASAFLVLQAILLWFWKLFALPLLGILIVRALKSAISITSTNAYDEPTIFLVSLPQAVIPLVVLMFLSFLNYIAYDVFIAATKWAEYGGYLQLVLHDILTAIRFWLAQLPALFVALALYLASKRPFYSIALLVAGLLQYCLYRVLHVEGGKSAPDFWGVKFLFQLALGVWMLWTIFYSIGEKEEKDWRAAFWLLISSICAVPLLYFWSEHSAGWPMLGPWYLVHGWSYLTYSHNPVGDWLASDLASSSSPYSGSLLKYLAPVTPFLWQVGSVAALAWWL